MFKIFSTFILFSTIVFSDCRQMYLSFHIVEGAEVAFEMEEFLFNNISKAKLGSVTNVTDQFVIINISGDKVFDLLSTGCPLNFNEFKTKKGAVAQTLLLQVDVIFHHKEINSVNIFIRRSFSEHLMSWIDDAASRF